MCLSQSPNSSHPLFPLGVHHVCSLLCFCFWKLKFKTSWVLKHYFLSKEKHSFLFKENLSVEDWILVKKWSESCSVVSGSLQPHGLYSPWNSPGQNTGVGSLSLLQQIFLTRNQTGVTCSAGRFFTNWAIRVSETIVLIEDSVFHFCKKWSFTSLTLQFYQGVCVCLILINVVG